MERDKRPVKDASGGYPIQRDLFWVGIALGLLVVGFVVFTLKDFLWGNRLWISIIVLLGLLGEIGLQLFHHHRLQHLHRKTMAKRADVWHESEQGVVFDNNGDVYAHSHNGIVAEDQSLALTEQDQQAVPTTFKELREQHWLAPGADMVIGFADDGQPMGIPELRSLGIAGISNSGKTNTTLVAIMSAIAKHNGKIKLIVTDPHMLVDGDQSLWWALQPLLPFLLTIDDIRATVPDNDVDYMRLLERMQTEGTGLPNPNLGEADLSDWMEVVAMEQERRKFGKKGDVWLIVIDEFAAVMASQAASSVGGVLERMSQQARKMNMFAILVSQEWLYSRVGGTELRHAIQSFVVHNTPESVAELIIPKQYAAIAPGLPQGNALFSSHGTIVQGHIVKGGVQDADWIVENFFHESRSQRWITQERSSPGARTALLAEPKQEFTQVRLANELPLGITMDEVEQIRQGFLDRLPETDIAKRVYNNPKPGPALTMAKNKVNDVLRYILRERANQ